MSKSMSSSPRSKVYEDQSQSSPSKMPSKFHIQTQLMKKIAVYITFAGARKLNAMCDKQSSVEG